MGLSIVILAAGEGRRMKTDKLDKILNFWGDTQDVWMAPDPIRVIGDLVDENYRSGSTTTYPSSKEELSEIQRYFREKNGKRGQPLTEQDYSSHKAETIKIFEKIQRDGAIMQAKTEEIDRNQLKSHTGKTWHDTCFVNRRCPNRGYYEHAITKIDGGRIPVG